MCSCNWKSRVSLTQEFLFCFSVTFFYAFLSYVNFIFRSFLSGGKRTVMVPVYHGIQEKREKTPITGFQAGVLRLTLIGPHKSYAHP